MLIQYRILAGNFLTKNDDMNMKKITLFPLFLTLLLAGCDQESPMEQDLYPQQVYIVGAHEKIVNRDLNIGLDQDTN